MYFDKALDLLSKNAVGQEVNRLAVQELNERKILIDQEWLGSLGWVGIGNTFYPPEKLLPAIDQYDSSDAFIFWTWVEGRLYLPGAKWRSKPNAHRGLLLDLISILDFRDG